MVTKYRKKSKRRKSRKLSRRRRRRMRRKSRSVKRRSRRRFRVRKKNSRRRRRKSRKRSRRRRSRKQMKRTYSKRRFKMTGGASKHDPHSGEWTCDLCLSDNPASAQQCEVCTKKRPYVHVLSGGVSKFSEDSSGGSKPEDSKSEDLFGVSYATPYQWQWLDDSGWKDYTPAISDLIQQGYANERREQKIWVPERGWYTVKFDDGGGQVGGTQVKGEARRFVRRVKKIDLSEIPRDGWSWKTVSGENWKGIPKSWQEFVANFFVKKIDNPSDIIRFNQGGIDVQMTLKDFSWNKDKWVIKIQIQPNTQNPPYEIMGVHEK